MKRRRRSPRMRNPSAPIQNGRGFIGDIDEYNSIMETVDAALTEKVKLDQRLFDLLGAMIANGREICDAFADVPKDEP
jgi:hypothetical protein